MKLIVALLLLTSCASKPFVAKNCKVVQDAKLWVCEKP